MRKSAIFLLLLCCIKALAQTPTPGIIESKKVLYRYGTVHIGNGEKIENSYVAVQGEEFMLVADANSTRINLSDYDSIVDIDGMHIYPGFVVMDSRVGLTEIGAVRATHDFKELGKFNPNVRSVTSFNTESKIIGTLRPNGVLMAQVAPKGGVISGTSSAMHFDGWNWKDATVKADEGVYLNWPSRFSYTGWWAEPGNSKQNTKYQTQYQEIEAYFEEAKAYSEMANPSPKNIRFEGMKGLFNGNQRLYIRADWAKDMLDVIQFARRFRIEKYAIVGGAEAHLVITELKENKVPVVIDRVHKLPVHEDEPLDAPFTLARKLVKEGIDVSFATSGDMEAMITRNLPFQVGTAVYYGLDYEKAIQALSLNPARLMGIDKEYGSITSGKSATFFICEGDPLDMRSNQLEAAFVDGKKLDLANHQTQLFEKFEKKIEH